MQKKYGMVIEQERCIGCEACSVACKIENNSNGFLIQVETQNSTEKDVPLGKFPNLRMNFLPHLCNHCSRPPCVDACPEKAIKKRKDGPVILNQDICTGCQYCIDACPYSAILFNQEENVVEKCNLCVHRIDQGLEPFCVICCEGQAIFFGDLNDPNSIISQKLSKNDNYQLYPEKETKPSIYYCPPKPRKKL